MRKRKRGKADLLRAASASLAGFALLAAIAYWMFGPHDDDEAHEQERQGINQSLDDYYRKK